jgi:hypothetical protein
MDLEAILILLLCAGALTAAFFWLLSMGVITVVVFAVDAVGPGWLFALMIAFTMAAAQVAHLRSKRKPNLEIAHEKH